MSERLFRWIIGTLFLVGLLAGYRLSAIPNLRIYKLVNLAGLFYAFLGVLVLSEMLTTDGWKAFCVRKLAPSIYWIHSVVPFGAFFGSIAGQIMHKPSGLAVTYFSLEFWGYATFALFLFTEIVISPRFFFVKRDVETRWRWLGFFLVLGGVGVQLIAAAMDLSL